MWHNQVRAAGLVSLTCCPDVGSGVRWEEQTRREGGGQALQRAQTAWGILRVGQLFTTVPRGCGGGCAEWDGKYVVSAALLVLALDRSQATSRLVMGRGLSSAVGHWGVPPLACTIHRVGQ